MADPRDPAPGTDASDGNSPLPADPTRTTSSTPGGGLGAVFTRRWAAELVLDLAGYTPDKDLAAKRATEPSCGAGAFLIPMIERLAASCQAHGTELRNASHAIRAWDLNPVAVTHARATVRHTLRHHHVPTRDAARLAREWVRQGDFLLVQCEPTDWVLGNPPYVRIEDVPPDRSTAYRERWPTMQGRADVYVGFLEAALEALNPAGVVAFICADRWMRNQYGKPIRRIIEERFAVDAMVTLHDSDAFENRVNAYPAIFTIRAGKQGPALVVDADASFSQTGATAVAHQYTAGPNDTPTTTTGSGYTAAWTPRWFTTSESWPTGPAHRLALVAELERRHPALSDPRSGIRLGIGLATGADTVYLTKDTDTVESDRLLPMVMASDLTEGKVVWSGTHLVNPWEETGLINLAAHPRTAAYYAHHETRLRGRHVGKRQPDKWYRTIDRPVTGLANTPKLLLPDLRHRVAPVLESQGLYPHHNLFWITSDVWDLRVLGGLLLSDFGTLFVETYSPRMAGGALRVTSQYLRRIRLPDPEYLTARTRGRLAAAFDARDVKAATAEAANAYGVNLTAFDPKPAATTN